MIGKSLADDLQYTKLRYKQYLYFSLNIPLMFLLCFFLFSLFLCLCFFFVYLNFYLMYYQDNNTEHHKAIYPPYSRNFQVLQKKRKQTKKHSYSLQLKGCAQYWLLVDINHYWLFKFLVEVKFLVSRQISSRSLVNVNYKHASEEVYPVLLKEQSIKSNTTKSCCKLYRYLKNSQNSAN